MVDDNIDDEDDDVVVVLNQKEIDAILIHDQWNNDSQMPSTGCNLLFKNYVYDQFHNKNYLIVVWCVGQLITVMAVVCADVARADVLAPSLCWWFVLHAAVVECVKWAVACIKVCDKIQKKNRTNKIYFASSVNAWMIVVSICLWTHAHKFL